MERRPKRRKSKDNPYTLSYNKELDCYLVSFKDSRNKLQNITITKEVYDAFDKFELEDLSILNEYDNHIEHSEIYEETLNKISVKKLTLLDDLVENKLNIENLYNEIEKLPYIQKSRLKRYYFEEKTFEDIAKEDGCTKRAIKFSVDIAIEKISKKLKK